MKTQNCSKIQHKKTEIITIKKDRHSTNDSSPLLERKRLLSLAASTHGFLLSFLSQSDLWDPMQEGKRSFSGVRRARWDMDDIGPAPGRISFSRNIRKNCALIEISGRAFIASPTWGEFFSFLCFYVGCGGIFVDVWAFESGEFRARKSRSRFVRLSLRGFFLSSLREVLYNIIFVNVYSRIFLYYIILLKIFFNKHCKKIRHRREKVNLKISILKYSYKNMRKIIIWTKDDSS